VKLTLFFTYGISLEAWGESGLLQREIRLYHELMKMYGIQVQFLTYGNASDRNWEGELQGIELLPIYEKISYPSSKILALFQTLIIPWVFRHELRKTDIFKTNQIWGGWVAVLSKWMFRKPLLVRCGYEFYDFSRKQKRSKLFQYFAYWISRLIYSQADQICVATSSDQKLVEKEFGIPPSLIELRPNWIDVQLFKPLTVQNKSRLLFVGRLNAQKNISLLLKALQGTDVTLDIIGEGELGDDLMYLAKKLSVSVNFLGLIPNDQMPQYYNRCKVYVLCSHFEGNPKTMLEAMACGCAVVGTNVPGIQEIIRHQENGLLVPEQPEVLREAIQSLLSNASLREQLGKTACQYIKLNNSLEGALKKEYVLYQQLCKMYKNDWERL